MSLFQNVLKKITATLQEKGALQETVAATCGEIIGITIPPDAIKLRDTTLYIKIAPTQKLAVTLNAQKIITTLQTKGITVTTIA